MASTNDILDLVIKLTGQARPLSREIPDHAATLLGEEGPGLGYSQFNELLLQLGYDRVSHAFFQYLVDGSVEYTSGSALRSVAALREGVDRFRKLGIFAFGNIKYAFKRLSSDSEDLAGALELIRPRTEQSFKDRHKPIQPINSIPGEKTYYLGYIIENEIRGRLQKKPEDEVAQEEEELRLQIVKDGRQNLEAYLVSDHLDVYVATSMRERHEYLNVYQLTRDIFSQPSLETLQLRYFDPTQAHCSNRIDKGLTEGLMLKRARCTIYFAQESDTLGKDSELASTLAQGKPVIAFVLRPNAGYAVSLVELLQKTYPNKKKQELILEQLRFFQPSGAWSDREIREWIDDPSSMDLDRALGILQEVICAHYDRRARVLMEDHPLGIQVNLATGVANGVLVVRTIEQCAELVRRVVMNDLEFELEDCIHDGRDYVYLREKVSGCIFRVVTGDQMLTNAFWNFYLLTVE